MTQKLQPTWDLDVIFPGQSDSEALRQFVNELSEEIETVTESVNNLEANGFGEDWEHVLKQIELITKKLREMGAFISCLSAQDVTDKQADIYVAKRAQIWLRTVR